MNLILKCAYFLCLGVWVGLTIFLSFVAAGAARQLEHKQGSKCLRLMFPTYYLLCIACGLLAFLCVLVLLADQQFYPKLWGIASAVLLAVTTGVHVWLRQAVAPRMAGMRDRIAVFREQGHEPDKALAVEWKQLHNLTNIVHWTTVATNLALLAAAVGCFVQ